MAVINMSFISPDFREIIGSAFFGILPV